MASTPAPTTEASPDPADAPEGSYRWYVLALLSVTMLLLTYRFPSSVDKRATEDEDEVEEEGATARDDCAVADGDDLMTPTEAAPVKSRTGDAV